MEKEIRQFKIDYPINWSYEVEISKIKSDLDAIEKLGATHLKIDSYISYDVSSINYDVVCERMETDEEFSKRVESENKRNNQIKERELMELARLKSKYNQ